MFERDYFILYFKKNSINLQGFIDVDLSTDLDSYRNRTYFMFTIRSYDVIWMSKLQKNVSITTSKTKYMTIFEAEKLVIWLKNFLKELSKGQVNMFFLVTFKVQFILQRIQYFNQR